MGGSGKRIVAYTSVLGAYDVVYAPARCPLVDEFRLYTDGSVNRRGWKNFHAIKKFDSAILTNRYYKFFPYEFLENADCSIYFDGNIGIIGDISPLVSQFMESDASIGLFMHRDRSSVEQEAEACISLGRFDRTDLEKYSKQLEHMRLSDAPRELGLYDNGVILRKHGDLRLRDAMDDWWGQLLTYTKRDQLSLPYVLWKHGIEPFIWNWSFREPNPYIRKYPHRSSFRRALKTQVVHEYRKIKRLSSFMRSDSVEEVEI